MSKVYDGMHDGGAYPMQLQGGEGSTGDPARWASAWVTLGQRRCEVMCDGIGLGWDSDARLESDKGQGRGACLCEAGAAADGVGHGDEAVALEVQHPQGAAAPDLRTHLSRERDRRGEA